MRLLARRVLPAVAAGLLTLGCAGPAALSAPETKRLYPPGLTGEKRIGVLGFHAPGGECLRREIEEYLQGSGHFLLVRPPGAHPENEYDDLLESDAVDLVLAGEMEKYEASSDTGTRNAVVGYLTGFIITAPLAAGYAAATSWKAYAIAGAKMHAVDTRRDERIWSTRDSVVLVEEGKALAGTDAIKESLLPRACKDLATKTMNSFLSTFSAGSAGRAPE